MKISLPTNRPPRILVTRTDRLGDLVLSTPIFSSLREKFPKAWITCLTFLENKDLLAGNPFLNEVILYDKQGGERSWWGNYLFAQKLKQGKFDLVIHLHPTNRMHWVSWLAQIPIRIGYKKKSAWALTHAFPDIKKEGKKHEAAYNFLLLEPLDIFPPQDLKLTVPLDDRARQSLEQLFFQLEISFSQPFVVFNPYASCPSKIWPVERMGELANKIAKDYDAQFFVIGSSLDKDILKKLKGRLNVPIHDLRGRLSLSMLNVFLSKAALLISNDSGPVHIASAVGTPLISLFGRNQPGLSPTRWKPLGKNSRFVWKDVGCRECLAHRCQINFLCLDVISAEEVYREVRALDFRLTPKKECV